MPKHHNFISSYSGVRYVLMMWCKGVINLCRRPFSELNTAVELTLHGIRCMESRKCIRAFKQKQKGSLRIRIISKHQLELLAVYLFFVLNVFPGTGVIAVWCNGPDYINDATTLHLVSGFVTFSLCGVWFDGLTTCPMYIFGKCILS